MDVAGALADLLDRSGLTKAELSRRSGVSRALLDAYLKGERQPSVAQVARLGDAAGLRPDLVWRSAESHAPSWAAPPAAMGAPRLSVDERGEVLVRVTEAAMAMRRRRRGDLGFPPFRELEAGRSRASREAAAP